MTSSTPTSSCVMLQFNKDSEVMTTNIITSVDWKSNVKLTVGGP